MDVDRLQRTYTDVRALMRAIKAVGAHNAAEGRARGLTGRWRLQALEHAYAALDEGGRALATWEIAYGHAWGAETPRAGHGSANEFHVPIESIGRARTRAEAAGD